MNREKNAWNCVCIPSYLDLMRQCLVSVMRPTCKQSPNEAESILFMRLVKSFKALVQTSRDKDNSVIFLVYKQKLLLNFTE